MEKTDVKNEDFYIVFLFISKIAGDEGKKRSCVWKSVSFCTVYLLKSSFCGIYI